MKLPLRLLLAAVALSVPAGLSAEAAKSTLAEVVYDNTPDLQHAGSAATAPALYLQLKGTELTWNGKPLAAAGRQTYVAGLVREAGAVYIVVTIDPSTRLGEIVGILDELRATGVTKLLMRAENTVARS